MPDGKKAPTEDLRATLLRRAVRLFLYEFRRRPRWHRGQGLAMYGTTCAVLCSEFDDLISIVKNEIEWDLDESDPALMVLPDYTAALMVAIQYYFCDKVLPRSLPALAVDTWDVVMYYMTLQGVQRRTSFLDAKMQEVLETARRDGRIGPAFSPTFAQKSK